MIDLLRPYTVTGYCDPTMGLTEFESYAFLQFADERACKFDQCFAKKIKQFNLTGYMFLINQTGHFECYSHSGSSLHKPSKHEVTVFVSLDIRPSSGYTTLQTVASSHNVV